MKRVLLKLSGEALAGEKHTGFDEATVTEVAKQVKVLVEEGVEVGVVIGGGNFWRGRSSETIDRTKADQIGMLATVMNCIYVSEIFRSVGMKTEIFTPFACGAFPKMRQMHVLQRRKSLSLQAEPDILISQQIQLPYFGPSRLRQRLFFLQKQWMVFMTVIRRRIRTLKSTTACIFRKSLTRNWQW